jgi:hypothetical protein
VTVVPNARIAGVALTGLHVNKALAAMGKTLELDSGKRVLCKEEGGRAHKTDAPLFHTFLMPQCGCIVHTGDFSESMSFRHVIARPRRRSAAKLFTKGEARQIAVNIAKLPDL